MPLYAICPFFKYEKSKTIGCEYKTINFSTASDRRLWMLNHCCSWDYECCMNASKLMEQYEKKYKSQKNKQSLR